MRLDQPGTAEGPLFALYQGILGPSARRYCTPAVCLALTIFASLPASRNNSTRRNIAFGNGYEGDLLLRLDPLDAGCGIGHRVSRRSVGAGGARGAPHPSAGGTHQ